MPRPDVALGDRHHQPEVGLGQLLLGPLAVARPGAAGGGFSSGSSASGSPEGVEVGQLLRRPPCPASMRLASATSSSAVSSGTWPISLRYIRTGSERAPGPRRGSMRGTARRTGGRRRRRRQRRAAAATGGRATSRRASATRHLGRAVAARPPRVGPSAPATVVASAGTAGSARTPSTAPGQAVVDQADALLVEQEATPPITSGESARRRPRRCISPACRHPCGPAQPEQLPQSLARIGRPRGGGGHALTHPLSSAWSRQPG